MSFEFTPTAHRDASSWMNEYFAQIARLLQRRFVPGYGGIEQLTSVSMNTINATPQVIPSEFTATAAPQSVTQDLVNSALIFNKEGVWDATWSVALEFTSSNQPRDMLMQLYNAGDDIALVDIKVHVGRTVEGVNPSIKFLLNVTADRLNKPFAIRLLSTADSFVDVILDTYAFNGTFVDIIRGL